MNTVLFDLGGVLIENVTFSELPRLLDEPVEFELLKERWLGSTAVRNFELGRSSATEFSERFVEEWKLQISAEEFLTEFATWPQGFMPGATELLSELRRNHLVVCLSNSNEIHWNRFGGFVDYFDRAFSSHLLGYIKPDPEVFEVVLDQLGTEPGEVYFFDDSSSCIEIARHAGLQAHLAESPTCCRIILEEKGYMKPGAQS